MPSKTILVRFCVMGTLSLSTPAQERQFLPLPINEVLQAPSIPLLGTPMSLSPDGQLVAYTLRMTQRMAAAAEVRYSLVMPSGVRRELSGSDIWVANTQTRESQNLTKGEGTSWAPVWSPDGRYLAFTSDRGGQPHLWLWDKSSNKIRRASVESLNGQLALPSYQWTRNSKQIVVKALSERKNLESLLDSAYGPRSQPSKQDTRTTVKVTESYPTANLASEQRNTESERIFDIFFADLAVITVETGEVRRIAHSLRLCSFILAPNDLNVAIISYSRQASLSSQQSLYDLSVASLAKNDLRVIAHDFAWDYRPINWSPDSTTVIYETNGPQENELHLLSVNGGQSRKLNLPSDFAPSSSLQSEAPWLWNSRGQELYSITEKGFWKVTPSSSEVSKITDTPSHTLLALIPARGDTQLWSPDGESSAVVLARNDETLMQGFYRVHLATGAFAKLLEEPRTFFPGVGLMEMSEDQSTFVYIANSVQEPDDIWMAGSKMQNPHRVTITDPAIDRYRLGTSRLVHWKDLDGNDLRGALLLPAAYREGQRYPLIVYVYGGESLSTELNRWGGLAFFNMQILATRGYAVFFPDSWLHIGTPMEDLAKSVLPGVEKLVELGIADPDHVGVMGHSYGGYSTIALIEQSKQFKAAVAMSSPVNLMNAYVKAGTGGGSIGWVEEGTGRMGGSLWQYRDRFIENSPLFYLDRVQAPLLLIHGEFDQTVPVTESRIAFESLHRLGKEVVYAEYEGEDHRPSQWSHPNLLDLCTRVIRWFDEHLKNPADKSTTGRPKPN